MGGLPAYSPMMATLGHHLPDRDDRWGYEMKWDGIRAVGYVSNGGVRLISRNAKDMTDAYPELAPLAAALEGRACVLDGEIVAMDEHGRPRFERLQPRMHQRQPRKIRQLMETVPVTYMIFDVLHMGDQRLIQRPYTERREILADLGLTARHWDTPPHYVGGGREAVAQSQRLRLEGVLAKRLDSPYRPGRRVDFWIKIKNIRAQEVVIGGWKEGEGRRSGMIGSLLLGIPGQAGLEFVGGVGTGFTDQMLRELAAKLAPLERAEQPFAAAPTGQDSRGAHWVTPQLVGEVTYAERTDDNRLRQPSWRGLRPDKSPGEVTWES